MRSSATLDFFEANLDLLELRIVCDLSFYSFETLSESDKSDIEILSRLDTREAVSSLILIRFCNAPLFTFLSDRCFLLGGRLYLRLGEIF